MRIDLSVNPAPFNSSMTCLADPTKVVYCNDQEAKIFCLIAQSFAQMPFTESSKPCEWRGLYRNVKGKNHERKVYQSIKPGDFQLFLNLLAEDVQWQLPEMENVSFAGTWHGREQLGECRPIVLTHPAAASSVRRGQPNLLVPAGRTHSKKAIA